MFSVLDKVKRRSKRKSLNILLIQNGYDSYCQHLSSLGDINIYLHSGSSWEIPKEETPSNLLFIQDDSVPMVGCFDKIVCIGKADEARIAKALQERFGIELILVNNSSEETYCPRPFTFNVADKVDVNPEVEVSMLKYFGHNGMETILPVMQDKPVSKKEETVVLFDHIPPSIIQAFVYACKDIEFLEFKTENILSSKVFIDTIVGLTPHLIEAMSYGCLPVVPYSIEVEKLLEGKGYLYNKYEDVKPLVQEALASKTSQHEIRELANNCSTNKQDFINKWNHTLGRSI